MKAPAPAPAVCGTCLHYRDSPNPCLCQCHSTSDPAPAPVTMEDVSRVYAPAPAPHCPDCGWPLTPEHHPRPACLRQPAPAPAPMCPACDLHVRTGEPHTDEKDCINYLRREVAALREHDAEMNYQRRCWQARAEAAEAREKALLDEMETCRMCRLSPAVRARAALAAKKEGPR